MTTTLLVDTHIFLWTRLRPARLTSAERDLLDAARLRYVSAASLWEIAILQGLERIERDPRLLQVPEGFNLLPISPDHCRALLQLPRHHRDPFDRMLVAQARSEHVPLLTRDAAVAAYDGEAAILRHGAQRADPNDRMP
jgi:PIN domain nuclease of toxin-antitoxin system